MVKKIDVILTKNHSNGEKKGNIINVSSGYAFNYLIPNQIAEIATEKKIKHIKMFEEIEKKQKVANEVEVNLVKEKIEKIIFDTDWDDFAQTKLNRKSEWNGLDFIAQSKWTTEVLNLPPENFKLVPWNID